MFKRALVSVLSLGCIVSMTHPASALHRHFRGKIVGYGPQGVYVKSDGKVSYVPWVGTTFYVGPNPISTTARDLAIGTFVEADYDSDAASQPVAAAQPVAPPASYSAAATYTTTYTPPTHTAAPSSYYAPGGATAGGATAGPAQGYDPTAAMMGTDSYGQAGYAAPPYYSPTADYTCVAPYAYPYVYPYAYGPYFSFGIGFGWPYWGGYWGRGYYGGYYGGYRGGYGGYGRGGYARGGGFRGGGARGGGGGHR